MKKRYLYVIAIIVALSIPLLILLPQWQNKISQNNSQAGVSDTVVQVLPREESVGPSIEDFGGRLVEKDAGLQKEPATLTETDAQSSAEDTISDTAAAWARVSSEEKLRLNEELDQRIAEAKSALEADPEDSKADQMLIMAETLKKLYISNFDYSVIGDVFKDKGGIKAESEDQDFNKASLT